MNISKINNLLLLLIILINGYTIAAPLMPALFFSWKSQADKQQLRHEIQIPSKSSADSANTRPNSVIIPAMLLDQPILDGPIRQQYKILDQGIWRWPNGSTPDKGGNTVLIGHRFTYINPRGVFYFLNKVAMGDEIGLWWNKHRYLYKVTSTSIVAPSDTAIENNTKGAQLTLFTCTPLWLPKNRLVVVANLETNP